MQTVSKISDSIESTIPNGTLVVFDSRVSDLELLNQALLPGSIGFTIHANADGLETISHLLTITGAKYLAIVAHGEPGVVHLGKQPIDLAQIQAQSHLLPSWGVESIALYSCEVAQGEVGKSLIYQLSELTGATVAAAATKTGNRLLGGSWDLTVTTGAITAPELFDSSILERYPAVLAVSFGAASYSAVGDSPVSVIVGDFNGDGKLDLATANYLTDNVSVLLGNGTGGFGDATKFAVGTNPESVTVGDFNNDGNLDLATANANSDNISVLFGNGNGRFTTASNFAVGTTAERIAPNAITVGDFNRDGKLDLATANYTGNSVSVLLGNGNGRFATATSFSVGNLPRSITVGDFNGDGKLDLATANYSSNNVSVLLGNGIGGFSAANNFAVSGSPESVTTGDFNGDGKLDLVVGGYDSNVSVLSGNGSGSFDSATNFGMGGGYFVAAGDFNGDGKLDLAADGAIDRVSLRLNTSPTIVPKYSKNDFNGDRKSDILWRNDNGNVALWQMNGASVTTTPTLATAVPTAWQIVGTGDFNGDRNAELLWRNTTDGSIAIGQYNSPTQTAPSIVGASPTSWQVSGTGDFNGDAKSDILWRNTNGDVALWQMNGAVSIEQSVVANVDAAWKIAGTGDFNGDGKADILWRNDDGTIAEWQMDGGKLLAAKTIGALTTDWKIAGTADFNGDGKSDLLLRHSDGTVAQWQLTDSIPGAGGGVTVSGSLVGAATTDWKITGTGDYNGDGKADILWRNDNGSVAEWQMNGSTVLSAGSTSLPFTDPSWKVA